MEYRILGNSGLKVSYLSLGTLTIGPLQANLPISEGASIIKKAVKLGVNLVDTAEIYETYPYIKNALKGLKEDVLVSSRSYAATFDEMTASINRAIRETGRNTIDLFMLHQQESELTLKGHSGAFECLVNARNKGFIKAAGISTHHIKAVEASMQINEIDFIFAPLNKAGLGIMDGTALEMAEALFKASQLGKGILVMKPIGGGHLLREVENAISYLRSFEFVSSITIGIQSTDELLFDFNLLCGKPVDEEQKKRIEKRKRRLHIEDCQGCGKCIRKCNFGALRMNEGKSEVDQSRCILCGYCASECSEFCIKVL